MVIRRMLNVALALTALGGQPVWGQLGKSRISTEPGAIEVEGVLPRPIKLTVAAESVIYYQGDMQRALGSMAPGTVVQLLAITENSWKIRGRARHGDVAGWMRIGD